MVQPRAPTGALQRPTWGDVSPPPPAAIGDDKVLGSKIAGHGGNRQEIAGREPYDWARIGGFTPDGKNAKTGQDRSESGQGRPADRTARPSSSRPTPNSKGPHPCRCGPCRLRSSISALAGCKTQRSGYQKRWPDPAQLTWAHHSTS
jgi:hypothetical protein